MQSQPTPLYVRMAAAQTRRLEAAVAASGKSKRQLIEDAVASRFDDAGLVVGRATVSEAAPEVLTSAEAAALLRLEEHRLLEAAERREVPGRAIGGDWRFSRTTLIAWLREGTAGDAR